MTVEDLSFKQIASIDIEHGLAQPIAMLNLDPEELSARLGIIFEIATDDLDDFQAAAIQNGSGQQFGLQRHLRQPTPGVVILTNERSTDYRSDVVEVLRLLQLNAADLQWVHPNIDLSLPTMTDASRA